MNIEELEKHIKTQIKNILCCEINISDYAERAVETTKKCLLMMNSKYTESFQSNQVPFSVYNSVQYCIYLYNLSKIMYKSDGNGDNAEKVYYLNKVLNSVDLFYAIDLPLIWGAEHPLGSVMGRAEYGNYFFFYQGCTVGGNGGFYPRLGERVIMYSNSKILGNSKIGNNVLISSNSYVKDQDIPNNCIVYGQSPNIIIKQRDEEDIKKGSPIFGSYNTIYIFLIFNAGTS